MHFLDTHASLPMTRAEEHKRARLKVDVGVRLALEARRIEEEEEHTRIETSAVIPPPLISDFLLHRDVIPLQP